MKNDQQTRRCKKCSETKPLTEFQVYDQNSGARRHACRKCNEVRVDDWRKGNMERLRGQRRELYWRDPSAHWTPKRRTRANELAKVRNAILRNKVLERYGEQCACCGEQERRFLTVDHVDNNGREMRKIHGTGGSFYMWIIRNEFPAGLQTLCMNCNFGKAMNGGICPHKTKEGSTTIPQGSTAKRPEVPRTLVAEMRKGRDIV